MMKPTATIRFGVGRILARFPLRCVSTSASCYKEKALNLKGKKTADQAWIKRQINDPYVKRARAESWRCRSAFKLLEIDDKHHILRPGHVVIDCGAAPGSWSQVAVQRVNALGNDTASKGRVIGIDLQHMMAVEGATMLHQSDFTSQETQQMLLKLLNGAKADVVLSDMAPNPVGIKTGDHTAIVTLCRSALKFAANVLQINGTFLCKLWEGGERNDLEKLMHMVFKQVRVVKPQASRSESAEIFLLAKHFQGLPPKR